VRVSCPRSHSLREKLKENTTNLLNTDVASLFLADNIKECSIFIKKIHDERSVKKATVATQDIMIQ
jgi:hypothetical protein